jgi:glycine/D-amino acid oxidase-like deaminating enzyme
MLSQKRDLRTGTPLWLVHGLPQISGSEHFAKSCDVAVVGTGVSGALMADALLQAGLSVVAVDRRKILSGSTPASTALLQGELDTPLMGLEKKLGKSFAARVWWRSSQAVQALSDRIEDLGIPCDHEIRNTLYLPGNVLDVSGLKIETAARQKIGLRSEFIGREDLYSLARISKPGAILSQGNAEVDPVKLVAGLWKSNIKRGARVLPNTDVTGIEHSKSQVQLQTGDGKTITAGHVVFCTGYELMKFEKPRGYKVISTWVLATKPQKTKIWPSRSLIWEAADPYLYLRTTRDGRIIVGGEDEPFSDEVKRDAMLARKIAAIARKASKLFPEADFQPEFSWTGSFGESPNGLPAIGSVKGMPRCFAVLGFGGNGITFSMLAAQLVSRQIQGITDPDAELFAL